MGNDMEQNAGFIPKEDELDKNTAVSNQLDDANILDNIKKVREVLKKEADRKEAFLLVNPDLAHIHQQLIERCHNNMKIPKKLGFLELYKDKDGKTKTAFGGDC